VTATDVTSWPGVLSEAFRGDPCTVHGMLRTPFTLPVAGWRGRANESDRVVLSHCCGPTLDIGCGPGRMTEELRARGQQALGIDVLPEAVAQAQSRGVAAVTRDVFEPVPGQGRWACALLADGNIGIGGDPVALLQRVWTLLAPGGRVVADLAPPGIGLRTRFVSIRCAGRTSEPFPWSLVGPESLRDIAMSAGFTVVGLHEYVGRWFTVLEKAP